MVNNLLLGEIRTMRFLRDLSTSSSKSPNRNVTQSIACYQDDHHFYFVMELVTGGNLLKFINKQCCKEASEHEKLVQRIIF